MRHIFTEYFSKNGIRFHHSKSSGAGQDILQPESHDMLEIILLLKGSATYKIEGQTYHLSPMDAIVAYPNELHTREIDPKIPYERMVLHFKPDLLPSFADLSLLSGHKTSFLPHVFSKQTIVKTNFPSLMRQCETLCAKESKYTDLRFIGIILQIVETLNEILLTMGEEQPLPPVKVDKISRACIQYINEHITERDALSPDMIAQALHISPSHLQHTFKKEIGVSLHKYVSNQRMQLARKLLLQGLSPQAVCNHLNYEYYSTFYNSFMRRFGAAPNSFTELQQWAHKNVDA